MKRFSLLILLISLINISFAGNYAILGSKYINPSSKYKVLVVSQDSDESDILIKLSGSKGSNYVKTQIADFATGNEQEIVFDLSGEITGEYNLEMWQNGHTKKSIKLISTLNKHSVFIQTDKIVYKTNDIIKYTVNVLNSEYLPYTASEIFVEVKDAEGNVLQRRKKKNVSEYNDKFKISDSPVLGKWIIVVTIGDIVTSKEIDVIEANISPFSVFIDTKPHVTIENDNLAATIWAKSEDGKYVQGVATVFAKVYDSEYPNDVKAVHNKTVHVLGKKEVSFDLRNEMEIYNLLGKDLIKLEVRFQNYFPIVWEVNTEPVYLHRKNEVKVNFDQVQGHFKPNLDYKLLASVTRYDGRLVNDNSNPIKIKTTFVTKASKDCLSKAGNEETTEYHQEAFMNNGYADIEIKVPKNTIEMTTVAEYQDTKKTINVPRFNSGSSTYLSITLLTKRIRSSKKLSFKVESTRNIDKFYYTLFGPDGALFSRMETFDLDNTHTFEFQKSDAKGLNVNLIVYYFHPSGDFIYDRIPLELAVQKQVTNMMDLDLTQEASELNLKVHTKENTFVGIIAMDAGYLDNKYDSDKTSDFILKHFGLEGFVKKNGAYTKTFNADKSDTFLFTSANISRLCTGSYSSANNYIASDSFAEGGFLAAGNDDELNALFEIDEKDRRPAVKKSDEVVGNQFGTYFIEGHNTGDQSDFSISKPTPASFSSIAVSGFSLHPIDGLIIAEPKQISRSRPINFGIFPSHKINLGEIAGIPIIITNNENSMFDGTLYLYNENQEFKIIQMYKGKCIPEKNFKLKAEKRVEVTPNNKKDSHFLVRPLKMGPLDIKVNLQSDDGKTNLWNNVTIFVKKNVFETVINLPMLVDLRNEGSLTEQIDISQINIENEAEFKMSAFGDLLGPALDNINNLIEEPKSLAEQAIFKLSTGIIILNHLKSIGKSSNETIKVILDNISEGYQNILNFKHTDGSFKIMKSHSDGSVWLTAYVIENLISSMNYIDVDVLVIDKALNFLKECQNSDGSYAELRSGAENDIKLTSFVALALIKSESYRNVDQDSIQKSLDFISPSLKTINNKHDLAIASYVLQVGDSEEKGSFIRNLLKSNFPESSELWKVNKKNVNSLIEIESASYALMALIEANKSDKAMQILSWLVRQRNEYGGFLNMRDTVVGLQALAKMSAYLNIERMQTNMNFKIEEDSVNDLKVTKENPSASQNIELKSNAVTPVTFKGRGIGIFQLSSKIGVQLENHSEDINFSITLDKKILETKGVKDKKRLITKICPTYKKKYRQNVMSHFGSDVIIIEIVFPSGFYFDADTLGRYNNIKDLEKVEVIDKKKGVRFFFSDITDGLCFDIDSLLLNNVQLLQGSYVRIYQYYNEENYTLRFFNPETGTCR